jgi:hypothetical protein
MLAAGLTAVLGSGLVEIYTGAQPATPDVALSGQTLLATLTLNATPFGAPSGGTITANAITSGTAVATGTAAWFRVYKSDGVTAVIDGSAGTSGTDMILNDVNITMGATVAATSYTISMPVGQ